MRSRHPEGSPMWDNYSYVLEHHVVSGLGEHPLRTVSPEHIEHLLVDRAEKGFSPATVRRIRNTLSQVFRWGVRRRQCNWDPASFAEMPPARVFEQATSRGSRSPRALTADETQALLAAAEPTPHHAMLVTAVCTGARPGELTAVCDEDLDLTRRVLLICRAWKSSGGFRHLGEPKTKTGTRTVALPPIAVEALRVHLTRQQSNRQAERWPPEWDSLVFTSSAGTPIHPANLRRIVRDLAETAGVGHLTPYDLRHTAASLLSDRGVPNHELADLLGHTTTRMVETHYRHRLTEAIDVAVNPMEQILRPDAPEPG
ncbi:MAG: site-specific integrase [Microthrixaceae bacterium]